MKKLLAIVSILFAINSLATNYYIDATRGNDANDGRRTQKAWKSIGKVNKVKFVPGDSVLFKRGEIFRGNLVPVSGSDMGSITYGAYGSGRKPKILGSIEKNSPSDWVNEIGNIWQTSPKSAIKTEVGNVIFNNESWCGIKVKSQFELDAQGKFWYDKQNGVVKMYSVSNPAQFYSVIEMALTRNIIDQNNTSYVTYENLDLRYGAAHGIGGSNTHHIWIKDLEISWIGGGYLPGYGDGKVRFGNGVEFWTAAHDNIVERCVISQVYDAALTHQGDHASGYEAYNLFFRNNILNNSEYSFELWGRPASSSLHDIYFENNTCLNAGFGWGHAQRPDPNGTHLMFWGFHSQSKDVYVRNNVFCESADYSAHYYDHSDLTKVVVDYNCWYESSGAVAQIKNAMFDYVNQWNAFRAVSRQDTHSLTANPLLNKDYTLAKLSPCIDSGQTTNSVTADYLQIKRPQGTKTDMGAFEYNVTAKPFK